jgi:hypothetical protein
MMKLIASMLLLLGIGSTASAQWTVYDPAVHTQQIIGTAQEIAKFVEMINNQVQQIQSLNNQLSEFQHYKSLFGDPQSVVASAVTPLVADLTQTELGESWGALMNAADGAAALTYDANGLYHAVGATFTTPTGVNITRNQEAFRQFAAINGATENYQKVSAAAAARRIRLKGEIAATIDQLHAAPTDAEVQKLSGVLTGLSAALASTEQETGEALANVLVQDMENRNDDRKQAQALKDEQNAAFSEAIGNYGTTFQLLDAPTTFPN